MMWRHLIRKTRESWESLAFGLKDAVLFDQKQTIPCEGLQGLILLLARAVKYLKYSFPYLTHDLQ